MRAVVFDRHGSADVLRIADLETPIPAAGQVRVRVRAAGIQPFDTAVRRGTMPVPVAFPQQLGNEFAGTVDELGPGVAGPWSIGTQVLGWAHMASLAEYVVADSEAITVKPADMPWDAAGTLGASGQTALTALHDLGVRAGETLLVHAAAGGAGTMAVQIARAYGARVLGTASARNHDYLRSLGATPLVYGPGLADRVRAAAPDGVDAVLDAVGGRAMHDSLGLVADRDRIGTLVDHDAAARLGVQGIRARRSVRNLEELVDLHQRGRLRVTIRRRLPLERIGEAHRIVETGHGAGKVVIHLGR